MQLNLEQINSINTYGLRIKSNKIIDCEVSDSVECAVDIKTSREIWVSVRFGIISLHYTTFNMLQKINQV